MKKNRPVTGPAVSGDNLLPAAELHARQHASVRKAHETELIEDYLELISELLTHTGEARAVDIAQRMGVSQTTVAKMIQRLNERELVTAAPYRSIFLTEEGKKMAEQSRARHMVVLEFLRALGVPDETARIDAEGMEHHVSDETLTIMAAFTQNHARDSTD